MKKNYTLGLLALLLAVLTPDMVRADELTVANGTTTNMYAPIGGYFINEYQHAQFVYPATLLADMEGGQISSLTWYQNGTAGTAYGVGIVVSIAEVSATGSAANAFNMDPGLTQVYTGTYDGTSSELVMDFSTPYNYGGGNLLIDVYTTSGSDDMAMTRFVGIVSTGAGVWTSSESTPNPTTMPQGIDFLPKATFTYSAVSACARPDNLTISNITEETFTASWTEVPGAEQYILYLDGVEYATSTMTAFVFSNLSAGTAYLVGVATDCGDEQSMVRTATARTACAADGITAPWSESFGDEEALACWTTIDGDGDGQSWQQHEGSAYSSYYVGEDADADIDNWLVSPLIAFSATDDSMMATWQVKDIPYYGNYGTLMVYAAPATGTDTADFTLLATTAFSGSNGNVWVEQELNLSAYSGQSFRLAFRHHGYDNGLRLDNLTVQSYYTPVVSIDGPDTAIIDQPAPFSALLVRGSEAGTQYTWTSARADAGEATIEDTPEGISITYMAGTADTLTLTAVNDYGSSSDTVIVPIKSPYVPPTVRIVGSPVVELGDTAAFAAEILFGALDNMIYTWSSTMAEAGHATLEQNDSTIGISYDTVGTDTLTVVATNSYGPDTARLVVLVRELNPITTLPYNCDFEDTEENRYWQISAFSTSTSSSLRNKWYIDTAATNGGDHGMYVSYAGGSNNYVGGEKNIYAAGVTAVTYAARAFTVAQEGEFELLFDWKCKGEGTNDFMRVFVVPVATTLPTNYIQIKASELPAGYIAADGGSKLNLHDDEWQSGDYMFSIEEPGTYMLVFCWRNDGSVGGQPPAAVDNIQLNSLSCLHPTDIVIDSTGTDYIALHWTAAGNESQWAVTVGDGPEVTTGTTSHLATGLTASTTYTVSVRAICGEGDTSFAVGTTANTECGEIVAFPWTESFENRTKNETPYCWTATVNHTTVNYSYPIVYGSAATAHSGESYLYNMTSYTSTEHCVTATPTLAAPANTLRGSVWVNAYSYYYDSDYQKVYEAVHVEIGIITDPENEETFVPVYDTNINSYGLGWQLVNFSAATCGIDANASLAFRATQGLFSSTGYFHIDDITVYNDGTPIIPVVEPCDAPTGLHAANATTNYIVVDWTPAGDETSWELERDGVATTVSSHPYIVSGLQPETGYTFRVRAVCTNGAEGLWSEAITLSTLPEEPVGPTEPECDMPTDLHTTSVSETSITLDWTPGGDETQWQIERDGQSVDVSAKPYEVVGLQAGTSYAFRIRAVCGDNTYSEWTPAATFSTEADHNSIAGTEAVSFGLYPNPATSSVTIEAGADALISIIDQSGRMVHSVNATGARTEIDVATLARGAYFVRVVKDEGTAVRKLIVK